MDAHVRELADLAIRWVHLIAGIMWIGNSMLFNWLDRNLLPRPGAPPGFQGEIWMVHSGGFYEIEKKLLPPGAMPPVLHWFKWQSYITWLSGFSLLVLVYYAQEGFLVDAPGTGVAALSHRAAVGVGLGALAGAFLLYDLLWRSPLAKLPGVAVAISFALLAGLVLALTHLLSGRAAYLHVGALLGTVMSGNVFFHIIPSQRELVRATVEGREQDPRFGAHAKQRSIHNNYITFPVLFLMLSTHFPSTYGSPRSWLVLGVIFASGALVRHFMNIRFWFRRWLVGFVTTLVLGLGSVFYLTLPNAPVAAAASGERVAFATVHRVIGERCLPCHSAHPTDDVWKTAPTGVMFDTPDQIKVFAERIKARAVVGKTMPLANKTHMTEEERDLLARWLYAGGPLD